MRRHPPRVSRKKLRAEIERLKGQVLYLQVMHRATIAVMECQLACVRAEAASRRSPFAEGGIVS